MRSIPHTDLKVGMAGEVRTRVREEDTAAAYGAEGIHVYATPALVGLVEAAAQEAVKGHLAEGWGTVGMEIKLKHLAPTPVGMEVVARAVLQEIDGRRLVYSFEAFDEKEQIAVGIHQRYIVNMEKFNKKAQIQKAGKGEEKGG
ncbi:MAG: thioesterase family protein [bacterium]|jgi:predicted thioesterase